MRHAPFVVLLLLSSSAAAKPGALSTKQLGAGGGYTHPSPEAGDYLENGPRGEIPPAPPQPPAAPRLPRTLPSAPALPPPAPAPVVKAPAAKEAAAAQTAPAARAPTPSLWNGLVKPLAAAAASGDEDSSAAGAREYDGASQPPALAEHAPLDTAGDAVADDGRPRDALFVSVELDPGEAGTLRDAVAGLTAAGFSADRRFEPRPGGGRASIVTGWLPSSRLAEAVTRPGVRRVSIETSSRPSPRPTETDGAFLIGLRVPDPARPRDSIEPALLELARDAGLRERRVLGLETAPDGRMVAVVSGRLPLARLSKALARADVVKLVPAPAPGTAALPAPAAPKPPTPGGFAKFMAKRGLWLVLLTIAVGLLPPARAGIGRGIKALVPYH